MPHHVHGSAIRQERRKVIAEPEGEQLSRHGVPAGKYVLVKLPPDCRVGVGVVVVVVAEISIVIEISICILASPTGGLSCLLRLLPQLVTARDSLPVPSPVRTPRLVRDAFGPAGPFALALAHGSVAGGHSSPVICNVPAKLLIT